jgi:hypothetical protein
MIEGEGSASLTVIAPMKIALTKNQLEVRFFALALSAKLLPQYAIGQLAAAIGSKASACVVFFGCNASRRARAMRLHRGGW